MTERERDAIELLDRIYGRKAGHPLHDAGMVEAWMDDQIMGFIRKHGPFAGLLAEAWLSPTLDPSTQAVTPADVYPEEDE